MNISIVSSAQTSAQEALETAAQTKAEAAKGDLQASRKVAASQSVQDQAPASPTPEGSGRVVNVKA